MSNLIEIVDKVGADAAAILMPHATQPYLFCSETYNMPTEWVTIKNPLDRSTANGRVYLSGKPEVVEQADLELAGHYISSYIIVPIIKDNKVISNLELVITDKNKSFPNDAQKIAEVFAKSLANSL